MARRPSCECGNCKTCKQRAKSRAWRAAHPERRKAQAIKDARKYRSRHPDRVRARKRRYYAEVESKSPEWKRRNAARLAAYAKAHPEKGRARTARYVAKNRDVVNAKQRERARREQAETPEKVRAKRKRNYASNRQRILERQREKRKQDPATAARHREKNKAAQLLRFERDPDAVREYKRFWAKRRRLKRLEETREAGRRQQARRRARLLDSNSPGVTAAEWRDVCCRFERDGVVWCAYCGIRPGTTTDHVLPLVRGGRDEPGNVVPACKTCNCSKGAKLLSEWRRIKAA